MKTKIYYKIESRSDYLKYIMYMRDRYASYCNMKHDAYKGMTYYIFYCVEDRQYTGSMSLNHINSKPFKDLYHYVELGSQKLNKLYKQILNDTIKT